MSKLTSFKLNHFRIYTHETKNVYEVATETGSPMDDIC